MISAIIFDLDGTLVHTKPEYRYKIVRQTLNELGKDAPNHLIDKFWFEARRDEIIRQHFGLDLDIFWNTYRKYDRADLRKKHTVLYDDTPFLYELKKKGIKLGVVTGAPKHVIALELDLFEKNLFDIIIRAQLSSNVRPKPDPHGIEECIKQLCVERNDVVFVGNADEDILAAKSADVLDAYLDRGEHPFDVNLLKPTMTITSLYELENILKSFK